MEESSDRNECDEDEEVSKTKSQDGSSLGEIDTAMKSESSDSAKEISSKSVSTGPSSTGPSRMLTSRISMISRRGAKRPNIVGASRTLAAQRASFKSGLVKTTSLQTAVKGPLQEKSKHFNTKWNEFQMKNWGKGWSRDEMRLKYKVSSDDPTKTQVL